MIAKFLAAYWQYVLIAALVASNLAAGKLWWSEVTEFAEYRAVVKADGEVAERQAKAVKDKQDQTTKELSDAYAKTVPLIEANAVANYRKHHPVSVQSSACRSDVPAAADRPQGTTGTDGARIPACEPDEEFIQRCAGAVAKVGLCRDFIQRNGFPIEH